MPRGGKRKGAGRPKGTGKFGEPTKAVRLPISKIKAIMRFIEQNTDRFELYRSNEPVGKNVEQCHLLAELVPNPSATFNVRMADDSMKGVGIAPNDLLIVDRSREPNHGDIVVALLNGKLLVRRMAAKSKKMELKPENPKFKTIPVTDADEIELWGVAVNVVHRLTLGNESD